MAIKKNKQVVEETHKAFDQDVAPVTSPFTRPSPKASTKANEGYIDDQSNGFEEDVDRISNEAVDRTHRTLKDVKNTPGEDLYDDYKANMAKGQGKYGMINDRDYSTTLRLARETDAYNSMPTPHIMRIGAHGNIQDLGIGYEKPKLETMETRAMDQAFELDTNQKRLAQDLQAAVARKDLDAFITAYKQEFGITLSRADAKREMRRYERQSLVQDLLTKSMTEFQAEFMRGFNAETAAAVHNLIQQSPSFANMLAGVLLGSATPSEQKALEDGMRASIAAAYAKANGRTKPNARDLTRADYDVGQAMLSYSGAIDMQNRDSNAIGRNSAYKQLMREGI